MKKLILAGVLLTGLLHQQAVCAPAEVVGTYIGTLILGKLDHDSGKVLKDPNYSVEIIVNANNIITLRYISGGMTHVFPSSVTGTSNFTARTMDGTAYLILKGKFTGKGKKLKATYYWSHPGSYFEGKISAKKM